MYSQAPGEGSSWGCKRGKSSPLPHQADPSLWKQKPAHTWQDFFLRADLAWGNTTVPLLAPLFLQRRDLGLNLDLSPPAVSGSAVVGLSFDTAAGAGSRAGLLAARSGSCCAEQPGSRSQVEQKQLIGGDAESLKWRPQPDPSEKMARGEGRKSDATDRGGRGETHSRCPSLVLVIICKRVTCSSPDLPPHWVSPPLLHRQLWKF